MLISRPTKNIWYCKCRNDCWKLKMCGIRGTVSLLINSYLSNRDQYVVYDDCNLDVLPDNVWVPQGSVSFLIQFNIFINEISKLIMNNAFFFADDAVFYAESVNFHELVVTIQRFVSIF